MRCGAAVAAAGVLTACGGAGPPEEQVTKSVRSWTANLADENGAAACGRMTAAARGELAAYARTYTRIPTSSDCAANATRFTVKLSSIAKRQMRDADVAKIRIDGPTAVVQMEDGGPNELVLRREGGDWRIDRAFRKGWRLVGAPSFGMTGG